jgi:hypothetical protein
MTASKKSTNIAKIVTIVASSSVALFFAMNMIAESSYKRQIAAEQFKTINVERINIIEPDGTVRMVITNASDFPTGSEAVNGRVVNKTRKKRSGMLFFNEEGIESGGLIYDGRKNDAGHSAGLSLTYDQYDGDQVMQLISTDAAKGDNRSVSSMLVFNDRPEKETQLKTAQIMDELDNITDRTERRQKYMAYREQGYLGGAPRVMLGKTRSENNGLFLFAKDGSPRAMFYVDNNDEVKFDIYNAKGEVTQSLPLVTKVVSEEPKYTGS